MRISDWSSDVCSSDLRHGEARGMDEGVQLQQVQARKLGIAKAGGGERRVEQDDGCIRGAGDPLPPAHRSGLATRKGDPVAGMACNDRGIRQGSSHKEFGYRSESRRVWKEGVSTGK